MYALIRQYEGLDTNTQETAARKANTELRPILAKSPGFVSYELIKPEGKNDVVASIRSAGGRAMAVQADVRDVSAVLGMVEQVRAAMGEVEVLVHNALIPYAIKSFDEISLRFLAHRGHRGEHRNW